MNALDYISIDDNVTMAEIMSDSDILYNKTPLQQGAR
jgi:hypothetical protein